jgi:transposase-like protein
MAGRKRQRDVEKEQFWRRIIAGHASSRLSVRGYCAEHGVSEPSFFAWRRELAGRDSESSRSSERARRPTRSRAATKQPSAARFAKLHIAPSELLSSTARIEIVLPRGVGVLIPRGVCRQTLADVLAVLESRPC